MSKEQGVFVKCRLLRGLFPTECAFRIESPGSGTLSGAAPPCTIAIMKIC
jgi:hypothetical protein